MLSRLRHGFASVRRSPTLALAIIATLGIALAATVIVFSFFNSFLLQPLPYGDTSRIAVVYEYSLKAGSRHSRSRVTYGNFVDLRERTTSFSRVGLFRNESVTVHAGDTTEVDFVQRVTPEIFPMIGVHAALGTVISASNAEIGGLRAALLSDALWRRRFGADPAIVGGTIQLDDRSYRVVGVLPANFRVPSGDNDPQAWLALLPVDFQPNDRSMRRHHIWAELAPGHSLASAQAELGALAANLQREHRENADRGFVALPLRDDLLGDFGHNLVLLQGAVLLVLVVAGFNCLCLLIARAIQRRREFAVRLALGAARRHLLAQLLAEAVWLALPAAALALLLANAALPFGVALVPPGSSVNLLAAPRVDFSAAAAVTLTALVAAVIFSCVPLLQTRRMNLEAELRQGGRSTGSPRAARAARWLAGGQIAVALALLITAALLLRSQQRLASVDLGFPVRELDEFRVGLRGSLYTDNTARRLAFYDQVLAELRQIPGVRDATAANFSVDGPLGGFVQESDGIPLADSPKRAVIHSIAPNFFRVFGLRVVEGRFLADTDDATHPAVAVINAALAAKYWPGRSAVGQRVKLEGRGDAWFEIVGVASDTLGYGNVPQVVDGIFVPIAQDTPAGLGMGFVLRCSGPPPSERLLQHAVWAVDPNMQFFLHLSPEEQYDLSRWQSRFVTTLVAGFALLAVVLSLAGIYAVNSFFVARRSNEFGVRVALGASQSQIVALVLRDSLRLAGAGLATGAVLAFAVSRGLNGLLYAVAVIDPLVYLAAAAAMAAACALAALIPARRAARVDPLVALRAE